MPELPEVETVRRGLAPALVGRTIIKVDLNRKDLRFPFGDGFADRLRGARIEALDRRAKYMLAHCSNGCALILHLGMTGRFTVKASDGRVSEPGAFYHDVTSDVVKSPHDHVVFHLDDGTTITYNDPRRFGFMLLVEPGQLQSHKLLRDLGPEPLGNSFSADHLAEAFAHKKAPLKAALLDQHVVAGLGNIYVCEALFRSGLSPRRKASTLVKRGRQDQRLDLLVRQIREILQEAIRAGGSTLQDFQGTQGEKGAFQQRFLVYDREGEPCTTPGCTSVIRRLVQSGRSTFHCPTCQK